MLFQNLYEDILVRQKLKTKQGNPLIIGVCVCVCVYNIKNRIPCLVFDILHTKILSHKFLNSLKYPYLLVQ